MTVLGLFNIFNAKGAKFKRKGHEDKSKKINHEPNEQTRTVFSFFVREG